MKVCGVEEARGGGRQERRQCRIWGQCAILRASRARMRGGDRESEEEEQRQQP